MLHAFWLDVCFITLALNTLTKKTKHFFAWKTKKQEIHCSTVMHNHVIKVNVCVVKWLIYCHIRFNHNLCKSDGFIAVCLLMSIRYGDHLKKHRISIKQYINNTFKAVQKIWVLRCDLTEDRSVQSEMCLGTQFQSLGAAMEKAHPRSGSGFWVVETRGGAEAEGINLKKWPLWNIQKNKGKNKHEFISNFSFMVFCVFVYNWTWHKVCINLMFNPSSLVGVQRYRKFMIWFRFIV